MIETMKGFSLYPDASHKFFLYDPQSNDWFYFDTEQNRDAAFDSVKDGFLSDFWDEEVENIVAGIITHTTKQTDRKERPPDEELDADMFDKEGIDWSMDWDYICTYKLFPLGG